MRQTLLILTFIVCVVLTAHYRMVIRVNAVRSADMYERAAIGPRADDEAIATLNEP